MKIYIKNIVCQGTRFFVLQDQESIGFGLKKYESDEKNASFDISPSDKKMIVKSLQENELESRFAGSIIKSEIRFLLMGWN